jgi:DNA-binding response OmpR family regulator
MSKIKVGILNYFGNTNQYKVKLDKNKYEIKETNSAILDQSFEKRTLIINNQDKEEDIKFAILQGINVNCTGIIVISNHTDISKIHDFIRIGSNYHLNPVIESPLLEAYIDRLIKANHSMEFTLDISRRKLINPEKNSLILGRIENLILLSLIKNPGNICNRDEIAEAISYDKSSDANTIINVQIHRLRKKLFTFDNRIEIQTLRNYGYSLDLPIKII